MTKKNPPKRKYDSTRRKEQARQTRLLIAEAARGLFPERGYAGATIDEIAQQAGVAPETVYSIFGSKRKILAFLLDISVGGDDQPIRILDRPEPQAVMRDTDQKRQMAAFSKGITEIMSRAAPVFEVMRSASKTEPEIAELLQNMLKERLQNMTRFAHSVSANGSFRDGLNDKRAGEMIWAVTSPELFQLLTVDLGWSAEQYERWLAESLARLLLP
jgi:TetR/AcrR family transcriptional regulator, regulator of autoinduction and epiphytic fitness